MFPQFAQFTDGCERTTPTGNPVKQVVESSPIETKIATVFECVGFGPSPLYEGMSVILVSIMSTGETLGLVASKSDTFDYVVPIP